MSLTPTELHALFAARRSCRAFRPDPVAKEVIEQITATARLVPSWCNAQPWQITVTSGAATDRLRAALQAEAASGKPMRPDRPFPAGYSGIYRDRRRACGWQLYDAVGVARGDRTGSARQMLENFALFGAPHTAILSSPDELGEYGVLDCGGFITAFMLAAEAQGVVSIAQAAVAGYGALLHRHFNIPEDRSILCAISFGYSDPDHPANGFRTPRADTGDIIDWRE